MYSYVIILSSHSRLIAFDCHPSTCFYAQLQFSFAELHNETKKKCDDVLMRWAFFLSEPHQDFVNTREEKKRPYVLEPSP